MTATPSVPGLCLIAEAHADAAWIARVERTLEATRPITLVVTGPPEGGAIDPAVAGAFVAMAQKKSIAALLADDVPAARATGADGVHLSWRPEIEDAYAAARAALGPGAIVGAEAGASRHDAMALGEAGADYVAFAPMADTYGVDVARETQHELVAWWADVFVVPVVAFDAGSPDDVADFVRYGTDFVAIRLSRAAAAEGDAAWASALAAALRTPADAA